MTCRTVREVMWQLADLDAAGAAQQFPEASAHLRTCAACRARLALIAQVAAEDAAGDYGPPAFTPRVTIALASASSASPASSASSEASASSASSASSEASEQRIVLMGDTPDDDERDPHSVPRIVLCVAWPREADSDVSSRDVRSGDVGSRGERAADALRRPVALALHLSVDGDAARVSASPMIYIVTLRAARMADNAASAQASETASEFASASASASAHGHGHALEAHEGKWTAWPDAWPAVIAGGRYLLRIEPQPASGVTYRVILDIAL